MILDEVADRMDAPVNRAAKIIFITKVLTARPLLISGNVDGVLYQFIHPLILRCRDRDYRNAQHGLNAVYINRSAVSCDLIHHIKCNDHGDIHLQQLHGQVQIALNVGGIHNVDYGLWLVIQHKVSGYDLLAGVRRHGINARKIRNQSVGISPDGAVLAVHCNARKISHVLIGSRQLVKQCGFSAVLISHQCICKCFPLRKRIGLSLYMVFAILSQSGMNCIVYIPCSLMGAGTGINGLDLDLIRICQTQRQFIAVDLKFQRIAHGRQLHRRHLSSGNHSHIQKVLPQSALSAHRFYDSALSYFQVFQCHFQSVLSGALEHSFVAFLRS